MNLEPDEKIQCQNCGSHLPPSAKECSFCGEILAPKYGQTVLGNDQGAETLDIQKDIPKPETDEVPSYSKTMDVVLILIVLLIGVILNFSVYKPDREEIIEGWIDEFHLGLHDTHSKFWRQHTDWPPESSVDIIFTIQPEHNFYGYEQLIVEESRVVQNNNPIILPYSELYKFSDQLLGRPSTLERIIESQPEKEWFHIIAVNNLLQLSLQISYWSPALKGTPVFSFQYNKGFVSLYWRSLTQLLVITLALFLIRFFIIWRYRNNRFQEYEALQQERTQKMFAARSQLIEARHLAEVGQIARSLSIVNNVLKSIPRYHEAVELKKRLIITQEAGTAILSATPASSLNTTNLASNPSLLYLRILGTPYAYQAPSEMESISIGRQRKKSESQQMLGNDIIVRVPGSDEKSLKISRQHLEIQRINTEYFVIDKSRGNTRLNGKFLQYDKPVRLRSGDRLMIANVLTLEILIRLKTFGSKANNILRFNSTNNNQNEIFIEASIGDMVTEIANE